MRVRVGVRLRARIRVGVGVRLRFRVDQRDEGGHLGGQRAGLATLGFDRARTRGDAAGGRLARHFRRVLGALACEERDIVAARVLARRAARDECDSALLTELVVELLEGLAQPLLPLAVLMHQVAARLRPTAVAALLFVATHATPAPEDAVLGPRLGGALQSGVGVRVGVGVGGRVGVRVGVRFLLGIGLSLGLGLSLGWG